MEVLTCRSLAVFSAALAFVTPLRAQTPTNGNNTTALIMARADAAQPVDLDNRHKLRPGDKVSFRIDEDREDAKQLLITDTGEVELPQPFGRFTASGKTCRELAQEIKVALEKDYYKRATVRLGVDTYNNVRGKVFVSGEVSKPGPINIPVDSPMKLSEAILLAGPPTQWAKLDKVIVSRGKETQTVDVEAVLKKGKLDKDITLEPGDVVIVPERGVLIGH
jgi:polysaccharide export outer membrane protein